MPEQTFTNRSGSNDTVTWKELNVIPNNNDTLQLLTINDTDKSYKSCSKCPLAMAGYNCGDNKSLWYHVDDACNWQDWLREANVMLIVLKSLLGKRF